MSFLSQTLEQQQNLLFVNFNQDSSSLQTGSKNGFKLYPLNSVDNLEFTHENNERPNIHLVERLFASSLVALVSSDHPRKLDVCHFKKGSEICNYSYSNAILAVKLNRMRLVVCLEESLYIHNIRDMKVLHTIRDTPPNPKGICALSPHNEHAYLAYPGSVQAGEVQIFDTTTLRAVINISAHDNPLAGVSFNQQGTRLATASEKGTVIRVFSLPDGAKLFEFRRGLKRCADIHCLAFSVDSLFLCVCSNTETVHIFKLEEPKEKPQEDGSWMGMLNSAIKTSASYFPPGISDVMNQGRSFATARLPSAGLKSVCTITALQKIPRLLVATQEGHLFIYNIDPNEGGECTLLKTHILEGQAHDHSALADDSAPSSSLDRPLTQTTLGQQQQDSDSYAATVRRPIGGGSSAVAAAAGDPSSPSGKPVAPPGGGSTSGGLWKLGGDKSYAAMLRGGGGGKGGGPQHIEPKMDDEDDSDADEDDPLSLMDEIMNEEEGGDSLPYQDPMDGAVGGEEGIGALRLQDDSEFPPVCHKSH